MGGSNEFVECFCGGVVAEGGSGAVVRDFPIINVGALQSINRIPTMVGQTRLQPRHDCSVIQGTKHPTIPHDQPPTSITATRKIAYTLRHRPVWSAVMLVNVGAAPDP